MKKTIIFDQTKKVLFSSLGLLAVTGLALADDITSGHSGLETMEQATVTNVFQVNPGFTYLPEADFNTSSLGNLSVWRFDVPASYTLKMAPGDLRLGVFYEYSEYDLSKLAETKDFNTLAFSTLWKSMINDEWGYFLYGNVSLSAAKSTALGNGLTGIGGGGVRYVWSPNLSLGLGAAVATHMEEDPSVLPIIALNWQINDRWNLTTLNGATIAYDVSGDKKFLLDLGVAYQRREYRIEKNVSMYDRQFTVELGATYNFTPNVGIRGFAGVATGRNIQFRYNDNKIVDQDVDASPIIGVRALFTF
jgi:hypothetical protein